MVDRRVVPARYKEALTESQLCRLAKVLNIRKPGRPSRSTGFSYASTFKDQHKLRFHLGTQRNLDDDIHLTDVRSRSHQAYTDLREGNG